jgi:hypothetical protein
MGNKEAATERAMRAQTGLLHGKRIGGAEAVQHQAEAAHRTFGATQFPGLAGDQLRLEAALTEQGAATIARNSSSSSVPTLTKCE